MIRLANIVPISIKPMKNIGFESERWFFDGKTPCLRAITTIVILVHSRPSGARRIADFGKRIPLTGNTAAACATSHTLRLNYSQNAPQTRREAAKLKSNRISKDPTRGSINTGVSNSSALAVYTAHAAFPLPEVAAASLKNELSGRVLSQYPDAKISVELMDKQELFKPCDAPTTEVSGQNITGRIPVRVRCNGTSPWSYFVQAHVAALEQIIVARHPIKRGMVIGADDLVQIETEIDPRRRYYTSIKPIVGSLAARSITRATTDPSEIFGYALGN